MEEIIAQIVAKIRATKSKADLHRLYSKVRDVISEQTFEKYFMEEFTVKFNQLQKEG